MQNWSAEHRLGDSMDFPNEPGQCPALRTPEKRVLQRSQFVILFPGL